ncbi:MAG: hypothetical protein HKL98_06300 [Burkholderiales bacterium]|nr:hypothetical protein [Burkholderiales bacterium]
MNSVELARRREQLVARCARERQEFARDAAVLEAPLAVADRGMDFVRYLAAHPVIPAATAAAFVLLRPARAIRWMRRGWFFWRIYRNAREMLLGDA